MDDSLKREDGWGCISGVSSTSLVFLEFSRFALEGMFDLSLFFLLSSFLVWAFPSGATGDTFGFGSKQSSLFQEAQEMCRKKKANPCNGRLDCERHCNGGYGASSGVQDHAVRTVADLSRGEVK